MNQISPAGVYVITSEDDWPCKVGVTLEPKTRLSAVQIGNWHRLKLHSFRFAFASESAIRRERFDAVSSGAYELELAVKRKLSELDLSLRGEWFDVTAKEVDQVIAKVADSAGCMLLEHQNLCGFDPLQMTYASERETYDLLMAVSLQAQAVMEAA